MNGTRDRIILGTSGLGADPASADAAVRTALALLCSGYRVDTSNAYADGNSERMLGAALAALDSAERDAAASRIITKVDADPATGAFDADRVLRSFDESRERLGIDAVPLLHLHDPYSISVADALGPGGAVAALLRLKAEGAVASIGIAAGPVPLMRRYVDSGAFAAVLCHNRFTLVDRSAAPLFAAARDRGMTVHNAAPFGGDLLVKGARSGAKYAYAPASAELLSWTSELEQLCAEHGIPLAAAALRFSTRAGDIDATVVGVSSPERLAELIALHETPIPASFWDAVDRLRPAPTPIDDTRYGSGA